MDTVFRLANVHHAQLLTHLFPGDGREAVAFALCGRSAGGERHILPAQMVFPIPYDQCLVRTPMRVTWSTETLVPLLAEASRRGLALVKIHSHPGGLAEFSSTDDDSDRDLFPSIYGWMNDELPHASAIMLPDGRMFGRVVSPNGEFRKLSLISVVGDDLLFWHTTESQGGLPEFALRHAQAFGIGTTERLRNLSIAVIGCSGTGSSLIDQLARLGVGKLTLVDPDFVEEKNLNRIQNTTMQDAVMGHPKVEVMARAIAAMGLGTKVVTFAKNLFNSDVVKAVAESDVAFGCMDTIDGRHLLNKLATFYVLPYFDVGVKLESDGMGGIDQVCGTVHYLQPGRSSLFSRRVYTLEQLRSAGLKRTNPAAYKELRKEKYIAGVQEDRPAVISVNMMFASLAVNELLARLHSFRDDPNRNFATYRFSLSQAQLYTESEGDSCKLLQKHLGRGDVKPPLDMPELSIEGTA
jgi:hypothetical protein